MQSVKFLDLGLKDYKETWDLQQQVHQKLIRKKTGSGEPEALSYLFFVEHPHVYTLGRSGHENNLLIQPPFLESIGASFYRIDRGGDITYHGPGQIVGYPVLDLDMLSLGVKKYIHKLEEAIIKTLHESGIRAFRLESATGVWLKNRDTSQVKKICAIGVKISRGITMHGFALNVNTDLSYFNYINPCGFIDKGVTSMQKEMNAFQDMNTVKKLLLNNLTLQLGIRFV